MIGLQIWEKMAETKMKDTVNKGISKYLTYKCMFPDSTNGAEIIERGWGGNFPENEKGCGKRWIHLAFQVKFEMRTLSGNLNFKGERNFANI